MCRMLALRSTDARVRRGVLSAFRSQADRGFTGPESNRSHRDGWGIVGLQKGRPAHFGRSPKDASRDAEYASAVERTATGAEGPVLIAHVRNASVGDRVIANTHPFVRDGWAFCHNGTVHGLEAPPGATPEGNTDSERFFLHLLEGHARHGSMEAAIAHVVPEIARRHRHSSLTFLLTDGRELFALRRVGPNPGSCGTRACALEHYTLGTGTFGGALVVLQEPEFLDGIMEYEELPDGTLLHVAADGQLRRVPLWEAAVAAPV